MRVVEVALSDFLISSVKRAEEKLQRKRSLSLEEPWS